MSDLISRSKLHFTIKRNQTIMRDGEHYIRLSAVLEKLRIAPAIDAVPVVHARWLTSSDEPDRLICSRCGRRFDMYFFDQKDMPYCLCGAKMDGGEC